MQIRNVGLVTLPVILALAAAPAWGQSAPAAPKSGSTPKSAEPAGDEAPAKGTKKEVRPAG